MYQSPEEPCVFFRRLECLSHHGVTPPELKCTLSAEEVITSEPCAFTCSPVLCVTPYIKHDHLVSAPLSLPEAFQFV